MTRLTLTLLSFVALLTACQKETDLKDPNTNPGSTLSSGLLAREVHVTGTDSNVISYTYNTAGRVTGVAINDTATIEHYNVVRNANGIITRIVVTGSNVASNGLDSLVVNVFYNAVSARYTHTRTDAVIGGTLYSDSTAITTDASGNITTTLSYSNFFLPSLQPISRVDYTYAGGNLLTEKDYSYDPFTSIPKLDATSTFTYDAKPNALKMGAEAIIIGLTENISTNNETGMTYVDATDPTNNFTHTTSYAYNAGNKPASGNTMENPGSINTLLRFYYN